MHHARIHWSRVHASWIAMVRVRLSVVWVSRIVAWIARVEPGIGAHVARVFSWITRVHARITTAFALPHLLFVRMTRRGESAIAWRRGW